MFFGIILLVVYLIVLVVCYLTSMLTSAIFWRVSAVFLGIAAAWVLWRAIWDGLRSMLSRLLFCARLKKHAEEHHYRYTTLHHPLRAFFRVYPGADIVLEDGERSFCIKFFPGFIRKKIVHIQDEKHAVLARQWALFFNKPGYMTGEGRMAEEVLHRNGRIDLTFEEDGGTPIVLLSPTCYKMTCVRDNRREVVDNDYLYGGRIRFYCQKGFLKCFERLV